MTDKAVNQPQHERIAPSQEEKGKLGISANKLTDDEKRDLLRNIQSSILKSSGSKHMVARRKRWFYRHGSQKAIMRKRVRRLMAKKSRMVNAKKRK